MFVTFNSHHTFSIEDMPSAPRQRRAAARSAKEKMAKWNKIEKSDKRPDKVNTRARKFFNRVIHEVRGFSYQAGKVERLEYLKRKITEFTSNPNLMQDLKTKLLLLKMQIIIKNNNLVNSTKKSHVGESETKKNLKACREIERLGFLDIKDRIAEEDRVDFDAMRDVLVAIYHNAGIDTSDEKLKDKAIDLEERLLEEPTSPKPTIDTPSSAHTSTHERLPEEQVFDRQVECNPETTDVMPENILPSFSSIAPPYMFGPFIPFKLEDVQLPSNPLPQIQSNVLFIKGIVDEV